MAIKQIVIDDYSGVHARCVEYICNPSWSQVDEAIRSLDGKDRSGLGLDVTDEYALVIGGGNGTYICQLLPDQVQLLNPDVSDDCGEDVLLVVGGQEGEYWKRECVPLEMVLKAAKTFFDTEQLDPTLIWRRPGWYEESAGA